MCRQTSPSKNEFSKHLELGTQHKSRTQEYSEFRSLTRYRLSAFAFRLCVTLLPSSVFSVRNLFFTYHLLPTL